MMNEIDGELNSIKDQIEILKDDIQNKFEEMLNNLISAIEMHEQETQSVYQKIHDENLELKSILNKKNR